MRESVLESAESDPSQAKRHRHFRLTTIPFPILIAILCIAAYLPAFNNGFIADDYVILQRTDILETNPTYLFSVPPENFRATSYLVFETFKKVFGYKAHWYYAFPLALHIINCFLFYRLLSSRLVDQSSPRIAAVLFAVFQAPQEAVMWLAAMNECLQAVFLLSALLLWEKGRTFLSVICFSLALLSKESAVVFLLILPLWQLTKGRPPFPRAYLAFLVPATVFSIVLMYTVSNNFMLTAGTYAIGFQAPIVILKTLFRLTWPWLYIVCGILVFERAKFIGLSEWKAFVSWIVVLMMPYMFINYQHHLPSRQLYMVSMVLMAIFARMLYEVRSKGLKMAFVGGFVLFNIHYLWFKKDREFLERAVSTTELVSELKRYDPKPVLLIDFPYPQFVIAKAAALAAPGWQPELLSEGTAASNCAECLVLRWDGETSRYVRIDQR